MNVHSRRPRLHCELTSWTAQFWRSTSVKIILASALLFCGATSSFAAEGASFWQLRGNSAGRMLVFAPAQGNAFDFAVTCNEGTGDGLFVASLGVDPPLGAIMTTPAMRVHESVQLQIASGPIIRQYTLRRVLAPNSLTVTDQMDVRIQTEDAVWREFLHSGRLSVMGQRIDASTVDERATIRDFMTQCMRQFPIKTSGALLANPAPKSRDGILAHPLTPLGLSLLSVLAAALSIAVYAGLRGRALFVAGSVMLGAIAVYSIVIAGPFSVSASYTLALMVNEIAVPAASAFGQLLTIWLFLVGVGLGAVAVIKRFARR